MARFFRQDHVNVFVRRQQILDYYIDYEECFYNYDKIFKYCDLYHDFDFLNEFIQNFVKSKCFDLDKYEATATATRRDHAICLKLMLNTPKFDLNVVECLRDACNGGMGDCIGAIVTSPLVSLTCIFKGIIRNSPKVWGYTAEEINLAYQNGDMGPLEKLIQKHGTSRIIMHDSRFATDKDLLEQILYYGKLKHKDTIVNPNLGLDTLNLYCRDPSTYDKDNDYDFIVSLSKTTGLEYVKPDQLHPEAKIYLTEKSIILFEQAQKEIHNFKVVYKDSFK